MATVVTEIELLLADCQVFNKIIAKIVRFLPFRDNSPGKFCTSKNFLGVIKFEAGLLDKQSVNVTGRILPGGICQSLQSFYELRADLADMTLLIVFFEIN